eukprot:gene30614-36990_t
MTSSSGRKLNLCPLCKTAEPTEPSSPSGLLGKREAEPSVATPPSASPATRERKLYNRKHFLSRFDPQPPVSSPSAGKVETIAIEGKDGSRLEKIVRMQHELRALTEQLSDMTLKMVQFQRQMAALTQEELSARKSVPLVEEGIFSTAAKADSNIEVKAEFENDEKTNI